MAGRTPQVEQPDVPFPTRDLTPTTGDVLAQKGIRESLEKGVPKFDASSLLAPPPSPPPQPPVPPVEPPPAAVPDPFTEELARLTTSRPNILETILGRGLGKVGLSPTEAPTPMRRGIGGALAGLGASLPMLLLARNNPGMAAGITNQMNVETEAEQNRLGTLVQDLISRRRAATDLQIAQGRMGEVQQVIQGTAINPVSNKAEERTMTVYKDGTKTTEWNPIPLEAKYHLEFTDGKNRFTIPFDKFGKPILGAKTPIGDAPLTQVNPDNHLLQGTEVLAGLNTKMLPSVLKMFADQIEANSKGTGEGLAFDSVMSIMGAYPKGHKRELIEELANRGLKFAPEPDLVKVTTQSADGKNITLFVDKKSLTPNSAFLSPRTTFQVNAEEAQEKAADSITALEGLSRLLITKVGPGQRGTAIGRQILAYMGYEDANQFMPDGTDNAVLQAMGIPAGTQEADNMIAIFRGYMDARQSLAGNLAVMQQGSRPSDADIKKVWLPLVPNPFSDSPASARIKWWLIKVGAGIPVEDPWGGAESIKAAMRAEGMDDNQIEQKKNEQLALLKIAQEKAEENRLEEERRSRLAANAE